MYALISMKTKIIVVLKSNVIYIVATTVFFNIFLSNNLKFVTFRSGKVGSPRSLRMNKNSKTIIHPQTICSLLINRDNIVEVTSFSLRTDSRWVSDCLPRSAPSGLI